ncbi:hypothetical protein B0H16DRAFT_1735985 [Mycena metata]|uniref:Uncharacterized protein n=1 Tax=Mycena metata TaxID=1033252 RepID=A0AAD7DVW1_9AGAR|nr:hypothetical protein B0H16DRAFT_1748880 [Mycena metata]KAJ7725813.1 hypothetical protein B0H16DRAFT_1735985 [Mycena metata]
MKFTTALTLIFLALFSLSSNVGATPLTRRNTGNPGTMKGYLQLRDAVAPPKDKDSIGSDLARLYVTEESSAM